MRRAALLLTVLLHARPALAVSPYTVPALADNGRRFPVSGNAIIDPIAGDVLDRIETFPDSPGTSFVLRRRFSPLEYGLYKGHQNPEGFDRLSAFRPPAGLSTTDFLHVKFYPCEVLNPNTDMTDIYFDEHFIYAENAARLFYHERREWRSLRMLAYLPGRLSIRTEPSGARVFVDGIPYGTTPLVVSALHRPAAVLRIAKRGYAPRRVFVSLPAGRHRNLTVVLRESGRKGAQGDDGPGTAGSLCELSRHIEHLRTELRSRRDADRRFLEDWEREYPAMAPQREFEKAEVFRRRAQLYRDIRSYRRAELAARADAGRRETALRLLELAALRDQLRDRLYHYTFSHAKVGLGRYEADRERFPVTVRVDEAGHRFTFEGTASVPVSQAVRLGNGEDSSEVKLYYRYRARKSGAGGKRWRAFYAYVALRLVVRGIECTMKGAYGFPSHSRRERHRGETAVEPPIPTDASAR